MASANVVVPRIEVVQSPETGRPERFVWLASDRRKAPKTSAIRVRFSSN